MKKNLIILLMLAPLLTFGQIKGENSKEPFTSIKGTEYKKGTKITLKSPSNKDKFAYVYKFKSSLSFGNIVKTVKNVNDVKNMNLKNTQGIKNAVNTTKNISKSNLVKGSVTSLQSKVVSKSYVKENAWDKKYSGKEYTIKNFKVYTDEATGIKIVHAIAKGKGGKVAILIDAAEEKGEIKI
ncbi:hypothetical protein [Polaribacter septentrionalilitoris]|uniref:hypothetical protein n=1 Tax=Polaribacter septentrionalilitoris TaxID=2494657 RepID=UPI00135CDD61|nr:hypothetical protein [Polaribacter septentrionalilitoris]